MRECPYCSERYKTYTYARADDAIEYIPRLAGFTDPVDWIEHLYWNHGVGKVQPTVINPELFTWEQADAWYHAQLLGVEP